MVTQWVSFKVIDTERQNWPHGYVFAQKYHKREGHLRVPFDHREGAYPLGHWISEQHKTYAAGQTTGSGIWLSNTAKLTPEQLAALAGDLGVLLPRAPQPGHHRKAHRPGQERQLEDDADHDEAGPAPDRLEALGRAVVLPGRGEHLLP